jgi:hypothetical protein
VICSRKEGQEETDATHDMEAPNHLERSRGTDCYQDSQSEIVRVFTPASP